MSLQQRQEEVESGVNHHKEESTTVHGSPGPLLPDAGQVDFSLVDDVYAQRTITGGGADPATAILPERTSPSFNLGTLKLMGKAWRFRLEHTPKNKKILYSCVGVTMLISYILQFFGINWWLHSFPKNSEASAFLQMIVPAILFQMSYAVPLVPYKKCVAPSTEDFWFWTPTATAREEQERVEGMYDGQSKDWRGVRWVLLIGFIDALGGLTAVYSIPKVAPFLQTMIYATAPIVTWTLAKLLSPAKAPPLNMWLITTFVLSVIGIIIASIQEVHTITEQSGGFGWILIFFLNSAFPNLYSVMQGRFLTHYQHAPNVSHWTAKAVVLTGDMTSQIFFTMMFFPLDSLPWFGSSSSPTETWNGTIRGVQYMFTHGDNFIYFLTYVFGFVVYRATNAFLSHYSPTLGAFVVQFGTPLIALLLIIAPTLNTEPSHQHWYLQVLCLLVLIVSCGIYSVYEEASRAHETVLRSRRASSRLLDDDDQKADYNTANAC